MKSGLTITELAAEIERQNEVKADFLVNTRNMEMESNGGPPMLRVLEDGLDVLEPLSIQETAHRQIGTHLGITWNYYEKMRTEAPDLLAYNVNRWLQKEDPTQRMLRTIDGKARAFLSRTYRRIDNYEIAMATLPIIGKMKGARFESCQVTENRMYLKVVNPRLTGEVRVGDVVQAGVVISNSETGQGSVNVQPLIYRLACLNGMVVNDAGIRRFHKGRVNTADENYLIYSDKTIEADNAALMLKIQDLVTAAVNEVQFVAVLNKMKSSAEVKLDTTDIQSVVKLTSAAFKITEDENKGVFQHLIEDGDYTLYGLANAITRFSQDVESYDRATQLESIGYNVMTMSPATFKQINQATSKAA